MRRARSSARRPDDGLFEADLRAVKPRPVFIIGLHRSGTTFLYQTITSVFPVASLTVYHVVNYDRILRHHHEGTAAAVQRELDGLFRSWHMATRRMDDVALSQAMPEEYGWILRRWAGAFHTNAKTAPLLDEICRKLKFLAPSAGAVLLKNPWDTGHVSELLAHFPDARFIFLQRDPAAIVNSQFRVARQFSEHLNPFVDLLFRGIPFGRTWLWWQRAVRKAAGAELHGRIALRLILRDATRELSRFETSWNVVPPERRVALDYEGLVRDLSAALEKVAFFLGLAPQRDALPEKPHPRPPTLLPEVAAAEAAFRRRLRERGIAQRALEESQTKPGYSRIFAPRGVLRNSRYSSTRQEGISRPRKIIMLMQSSQMLGSPSTSSRGCSMAMGWI
jgi:hypothetical protein